MLFIIIKSFRVLIHFMFIVIEAIDGAGKDTQIDLLKKTIKFSYFKYPTSGNKRLRAYLEKKEDINGSELVDLFLDDIYSEQGKVADATKLGLTISDRYLFSTIAYESHLVDFDEIKKRAELHGFIKPDLVVLLDIHANVAQQRKAKQKKLDRYEENINYLENVRKQFLRLYEERYFAKKWVKIDATRSIEAIHKDILNVLKK